MNGQDILTEAGTTLVAAVQRYALCPHRPQCPEAGSSDRAAARTVASHPEQGWSLLCNGVIEFDDLGELLPDGRAVVPPATTRPYRKRGAGVGLGNLRTRPATTRP
jgi:hypothetical protein